MAKKEKINLEKTIGDIALGNYLSDYTVDKSYGNILEIIQGLESCCDSDPDDLVVWEKFEHDDPNDVVEHISLLYEDVKGLLVNVLTEIKDGVTTVEDVLKTLKGI